MAVKVFFYTLRPYDEQGILEDLAKQRGIEYGYFPRRKANPSALKFP